MSTFDNIAPSSTTGGKPQGSMWIVTKANVILRDPVTKEVFAQGVVKKADLKPSNTKEDWEHVAKFNVFNKHSYSPESLEPTEIVYRPDKKVTKVVWSDGSETKVKCHEDEFSKEFGFAMALAKKVYGRSEFLRLIENATVLESNKNKERKNNDINDVSEYESELGEVPNKKKTVQEAVRKCFELADSVDDLYEMISNFEGSTK